MSIASQARCEKRPTSATKRGGIRGTPSRDYKVDGSGVYHRRHAKPVKHRYGEVWAQPNARILRSKRK